MVFTPFPGTCWWVVQLWEHLLHPQSLWVPPAPDLCCGPRGASGHPPATFKQHLHLWWCSEPALTME